MRILVVGAGRMGFSLAQQLDAEGHEVYVVDPDAARVEAVRARLDVMAIQGSGCSIGTLRDFGVGGADLLLAVSGSDEVNIVSCLVAKELGINRRMARIESRDLAENLREMNPEILGVDEFVNPREVTVARIRDIVTTPGTTMSAEFENDRIIMRGFRVAEGSDLTRQPLARLHAIFIEHFLVAAVQRGEELHIPKGDFRIEPDDTVFVVMERESLGRFLKVFRFETTRARRIFVGGASEIGIRFCEHMEGYFSHLILVDEDPVACRRASGVLRHTAVIEGDPLDQDLMIDLKIEGAHYFLGVGDVEEANFSSALLAKRLGAECALMLTENPTHVRIFDSLPLDAVLNPAILSVGALLRRVRAGNVLSLFMIAGNRGEAVELRTPDGCPIAGKALKDIDFPPGVVVAAVTGKEGSKVAGGGTVIEAGDRVVIVALKEAVQDAIALFGNE